MRLAWLQPSQGRPVCYAMYIIVCTGNTYLRISDGQPKPTLFTQEFSINDRVALVTGGHGDLGLEMSLALIEAGARAVYCVDRADTPSERWLKIQECAKRMADEKSERRRSK